MAQDEIVKEPVVPKRQIMHQHWRDITFVHWRVDAGTVAPLLPRGTTPDVHDGSSWVGLIPFRMVGAGVTRGPAVPWLGTFAETNVRLYARDATGRPGVVFRSLDADRLAVVLGARAVFGLPYMWARMRVERDAETVTYRSSRLAPGPRGAGGRLVVRPGAPLAGPEPLADFLTARWGLHVTIRGRLRFVPNHHEPWPLRRAELLHLEDTLVAAAGLPGVVERPPDSVLFSTGVRAVFGPPSG